MRRGARIAALALKAGGRNDDKNDNECKRRDFRNWKGSAPIS